MRSSSHCAALRALKIRCPRRDRLLAIHAPSIAPKSDAATEGAIRLFGLQTLAAPQVFYRESSSQIERAGGLELPLGTRSAASQHGGPVSALRHPMSGDGERLASARCAPPGTTLLPDMCPQRLGVAWSSRWMAATPACS